MKKLILPLCLLMVCGGASEVKAQGSYKETQPELLFDKGKSMYAVKNWDGCLDFLKLYKSASDDQDLIQESDFMIVVANYEKERIEAQRLLSEFIIKYPASRYIHQVRFLMGSTNFLQGDFALALSYFETVDMAGLTAEQQPLYLHRTGISYIKVNRLDRAEPIFKALSAVKSEYSDAADYYLAYIRYCNKDYDAALAQFNALPPNPAYSSEVPYYVAQIMFYKGNYEAALEKSVLLLNDCKINKKRAELSRIAGESSYYLGKKSQALPYLKEYVSLTSSPLRSTSYILGVVAFENGDYSTAVANLSRTTSVDDATAQSAWMYLGQSYVELGERKNACLAFEAASKSRSNEALREAAMYNYTIALYESAYSPFNESLTAFENFLAQYPKSKYTEQVQNTLADVYMTTKNYDAALLSIDKISNPNRKIQTARQRILFQLGAQKVVNSDITGASLCFDKSIALGPLNNETFAQSYFWRGECSYRQEKYDAAGNDFKKFQSATTDKKSDIYALASYNLGYTYFKKRNFSDAARSFENYVAVRTEISKPTYVDALNRLADSYFYQRDFSKAERYYNRSAEISGAAGGDYALYQKGFMAGLQKNYDIKIKAMDDLLSAYPDSEYADDALTEKAKTYMLKNDSFHALQAYNELVEKYPGTASARQAYLQMGLIYFNNNKYDESIDSYKSVISRFPGSEEAALAAEDLKSVYIEKNDVGSYAEYVKSLDGKVTFAASEQDSLTYIAAEKSLSRKDKEDAKNALKRYLSGFESGAFRMNANMKLARLYLAEKNESEAMRYLENIINAPSNRFTDEALVDAAIICEKQERTKQALEYYQRLLANAEQQDMKKTANTGILRTAQSLDFHKEVIEAATNLLAMKKLDQSLRQTAIAARADAYIELEETDKALADLAELSSDTRTQAGAQAKYQLAQIYFNNGDDVKSEAVIMELIDSATPHQYWMARSFILLSDIYIGRNDMAQARIYLESLKSNYKSEDDIQKMIDERFSKIGQE